MCAEHLVLPFSLAFGFNSPLLVCFLFGGDQPLNSWFDGLFVTILILSSQVLNLLESRVLTNWRFCVLEKTPILFDLSSISLDP